MALSIGAAVEAALQHGDKPLAIVLAGHNGSGKSTLWYQHLANRLKIPLINADRMMMSILPEVGAGRQLVEWAQHLRDTNEAWMSVAQQGVTAFMAAAIGNKVPFAVETVFSHWQKNPDGTVASKIDIIKNMQAAGYFVVLIFVGLASANLSVGRVETRRRLGGHAVPFKKLLERFPRTQQAVGAALEVADASVLFDNSRSERLAFTPVHIRSNKKAIYDIREVWERKVGVIARWLDVVAPL